MSDTLVVTQVDYQTIEVQSPGPQGPSSISSISFNSSGTLTITQPGATSTATPTGFALTGNITTTGGSVGVGTATPSSRLTVSGDVRTLAGGTLILNNPTNTAAGSVGFVTGDSLVFYGGGSTERMRIDASGRVGISTTSPDATLSVDGTIRVGVGSPTTGFKGLILASSLTDTFTTDTDKVLHHYGITAKNFSDAPGSPTVAISGYNGFRVYTNAVERMRLDASGNLGLGVTPNAWTAGGGLIQVPGNGFVGNNSTLSSNSMYMGANAYYDTAWKYRASSLAATIFQAGNGSFTWYNAPSGTAGTAITWTTAMTLNSSGSLGIGTTSPAYKVHANATGNTQVCSEGTTDASFITRMSGVQALYLHSTTASSEINELRAVPLTVSVNGAERMRIDASGNVGIGTTTSATALGFANGAQISWGSSNYAYVSGSNATNILTFGTQATERMRIDASGNLGLGVTPSAWGSNFRGLQVGAVGSVSYDNNFGQVYLGTNFYMAGAGAGTPTYLTANPAARLDVTQSGFVFRQAASGAAGNTITWTNAMTLDASGNLGLGATPNAWSGYKAIQVGAYGNLSYNAGFSVLGTNAFYNGTAWAYQSTGRAVDYYQDIGSGSHNWRVAASGTAGATITWTTAMILDSSGDLGLGQGPSAWGNGYNAFQTKGGNVYSSTTGNMVMGQNYYNDGTNFIRITANPTTYYSQSGGTHVWGYAATGTAGSTFTFTEAARVDNAGVFRVGHTAGIPNPGVALNPAGGIFIGNNAQSDGWGFISFNRSGTQIGGVSQSGTGTSVAYNTTSDARLKTNIEPAPDSGAVVDAIRVVSYDWRAADAHVDFGVIAQELYEVFPGAVTPGDDDRPWSWDASFLVPLLVKELQSLRARVTLLETP